VTADERRQPSRSPTRRSTSPPAYQARDGCLVWGMSTVPRPRPRSLALAAVGLTLFAGTASAAGPTAPDRAHREPSRTAVPVAADRADPPSLPLSADAADRAGPTSVPIGADAADRAGPASVPIGADAADRAAPRPVAVSAPAPADDGLDWPAALAAAAAGLLALLLAVTIAVAARARRVGHAR
jgi:hypothetical protein